MRREDTPEPQLDSIHELLTLEQFAARLQISRSTVYNWLAESCLIAGKHFIRINRVIRIVWSNGLLEHLMAMSSQELEEKPQRLRRTGKGGRNCCSVDFDYLDVH